MYTYSKEDLNNIKYYGIKNRVCRANKRFDDKLTLKDVLNLLIRFNYSCVYCGCRVSPKHWQLDHFYSKAMGGKNKIDNLAPSCKWCNQMKNALDGYAFIERCKKITENNIINHFLKSA